MDLACDFAFDARTSVFQLLSTPDEGLELASEISASCNSPLLRRAGGTGRGAALIRTNSQLAVSVSARDLGSRMATNVTPRQQMAAALLCLLMGLGAMTSWFAIGSSLLYFSSTLPVDRPFFIWMLTAYYGPMIALLAIQRAVERKAKWWRSAAAFALRLSLSYAGCTVAMLLMPHVTSQPGLLALAAAVGVVESFGLGAASQLFKLLPAQCYGYYFAGTSIACVAVIAVSFVTGFAQPQPSHGSLVQMFYFAAVMAATASVAGFGILLSRLGRHYIRHGYLDLAMADTGKYHATMTSAGIFVQTWRYQLGVLSVSMTSVLATGLVPFIPSQTDTWYNTQWRLVLLYVIMVSMVIGRQLRVSRLACIPGGKSLAFWVVLRLLLAVVAVVYVLQPIILPQSHKMYLSDVATVVGLVVFGASGGVLLPPLYDQARSNLHPMLHTKLDRLFVIWGGLGVYIGLFAAFVVATTTINNTTSLIPFSFIE